MEGRRTRTPQRLTKSRPRDTLRLFFALWPDDTARAALADLTRSLYGQCGGWPVLEWKLHLTLLFLGSVRAELVADLRHMASRIRIPPVTLVFDRVEYWRRKQLMCLGATCCPPPLSVLVGELAQGAHRLDLTIEERPYVPHITLLRRAPRGADARDFKPVVWPIAEFALVQSVLERDGSAYAVIDRWPVQEYD
jgi:RNA 2',3'-cyclic 3'-phosphodiesterase